MNKLIDKIKKEPIILAIIIILLFFMPMNLASPSESTRNAIITAIGVDKTEQDYEISLLTFIPTPGKEYVENYGLISTKAENLSGALSNSSLQIGKQVKLFHTEMVILGEGIFSEDISSVLEFFAKEKSLSKSAMLIGTNSSAKKVLEFLQKNDSNPSEKLSQLMLFNSSYVFYKETTLETFFSGYYSPIKSSFLAYLTFSESNGEDSIILNSTGEKSSSEEEKQGSLKNNGDMLLLREGEKVDILSRQVAQGINLLKGEDFKSNVTINNSSDIEEVYKIRKKSSVKSVRFENSVPVYTINLEIIASKLETVNGENNLDENLQLSNIDAETCTKIESEIKKQVGFAVGKLRENRTDIANIYREFYQKRRSDFKRFLQTLDNQEDFLNYVIFEMNVKVVSD